MGSQQSLLRMRGYALLEEIGKKDTGNVVLVNKNGSKCIIKTTNMSNMDQETRQKLKWEVATLADMDHPHIVRYVESFEDENSNHYIVMDYCEGGDLSEQIKAQKEKGTKYSEDQILDWFVQICLAVKHIHDRGIIHRDIKPQNLFLTKEENIKLGDFGVSGILSRKDEYPKIKSGTPLYFAPEVWKNECFDEKSDIWALGCVLYELCTLEFAFSLQEHCLFLFELWNRPAPCISENFSLKLHHLVDELLHKDPACRPSINGILKKDFLADRIPRQLLLKIIEEENAQDLVPLPLEESGDYDLNHYIIHDDPWLYVSLDFQQVTSDRNLKKAMSQLKQNTEAFKKLYDQNASDIQEIVKKLQMTADGLERVHFGTTVGSLTGGVVGAAGGITSVVGLILAPFTLGASLIVTGVGIGVAVAGGATSAISNITNMVNQSTDRRAIEMIINEYREKMEPILMSVEDIIISIQILQAHESFSSAANMAQAACKIGRGLGGIAELVRLIQVVNIGKVAAQAARAVRVAEAFTGVLSALFIAMDVYFIVKDAKEIHNIRQVWSVATEATNTADSSLMLQSRSQHEEIKSATMKVIVNIREMASQFKEKLDELKCIREELETLGG